MHELIARGAAAVRRDLGWTQEEAARHYRDHGLTTWRTGNVGSLEAGQRKPRLDEVILMCAALKCTLADLIRAADEDGAGQVELGDGAVLSTRMILGWLYEGFEDVRDIPHLDPLVTQRFPFSDKGWAAIRRMVAYQKRLWPVLRPIAAWAAQHEVKVTHEMHNAAFRTPSEADRRAARRFGINPAAVRLGALVLWRQDFERERDARIGDLAALEPRSRQARRGLVTREMLAEMEQMLREAREAPPDEDAVFMGKPLSFLVGPPEED